jgi:hypothetical protein
MSCVFRKTVAPVDKSARVFSPTRRHNLRRFEGECECVGLNKSGHDLRSKASCRAWYPARYVCGQFLKIGRLDRDHRCVWIPLSDYYFPRFPGLVLRSQQDSLLVRSRY